jgi:hypothetical protein
MADIQPVCAGTFSRHRPFVRGSELVQRFHEIDHILPNTTSSFRGAEAKRRPTRTDHAYDSNFEIAVLDRHRARPAKGCLTFHGRISGANP